MPGYTRRVLLAASAGLVMTEAHAADTLAWDFAFPDIDGGTLKLAQFKGNAIMVVNTASFCGFTYQYEALEKLHKARKAAGFAVQPGYGGQ